MKLHGQDISRRRFDPVELYRLITARPSPRRVRVNTQLRFLHEVIGLQRFNYGIWDGESPGRSGLISAQERYADKLAEWIPDGVESILDVGCGVGTDTQRLSQRGYVIEGLSPDPYQRKVFTETTALPFHLCRFQEFQPTRTYDLVMMAESAQYVWLDSLFPTVTRVTPGGHLLLADYFTVTDGDGPEHKSGHRLTAFDDAAREHGLELLREQDVTSDVLPTLELGSSWLDDYVSPSLEIALESVQRRVPLGRTLIVGRARAALERLRRSLDPGLFRDSKRYLFRLYRVGPRGSGA